MKLPKREEAEGFIAYAEERNRGQWVAHSYHVAHAAEKIAANIEGMDTDRAYIMGLLHDIGRVEGRTYLHHVVSGYNFLKDKGYEELAEVALSHSFSIKTLRAYTGEFDCTQEEIEFIEKYLENVEFDDYHKLIQLCDTFAAADGVCLMEKRMVDVVMRYGTAELTHVSWKKRFELKEYFEQKMGKSIYSLFDDVIDNTFGNIKNTD